MKKLLSLLLISTLGFTNLALAEGFSNGSNSQNSGGFDGGTATITTVEQAKKMSDDAWITLQGNIVEQVGDENYLFQDKTGSIKVEIDRKDWKGQTIKSTDLVEITGKLDKDWTLVEIDVKNIKVISSQK